MASSNSLQVKKYYRIQAEPFSGSRTEDGKVYSRLRVDLRKLPVNQPETNFGTPIVPDWLDEIVRFEKVMASFFLVGTKGLAYRIDKSVGIDKSIDRHEVNRLILPETKHQKGPSRGERFKRDMSLVQRARETEISDPSRLFRKGGDELRYQFSIDNKITLNRELEEHTKRYANTVSPTIQDHEFARVRYQRFLDAVVLREFGQEIFSCGRNLWLDYEDRDHKIIMEKANIFLSERLVPERMNLERVVSLVFNSGINVANYWACFSNLWDVFEVCAFIARETNNRQTDRDKFYYDLYFKALKEIISSTRVDELSKLKTIIMNMAIFYFHENNERAAGKLPPLDGVKSILPPNLDMMCLFSEGDHAAVVGDYAYTLSVAISASEHTVEEVTSIGI